MKGPALVSFYSFSFLFGGSRELQAPLSSSWSRGAQLRSQSLSLCILKSLLLKLFTVYGFSRRQNTPLVT